MEWSIGDDFPVRFNELSNPKRRLRTVNALLQFFLTPDDSWRRIGDAPPGLPSPDAFAKFLSFHSRLRYS